jgi:hypothetical protein
MKLPERTERLEREVAAAFTEVLAPRPGDEAKLAAMLELALRPPPGGAPPGGGAAPARPWPRLVGAGGIVIAAVALLATGRTPRTVGVVDVPAALAPARLPDVDDAGLIKTGSYAAEGREPGMSVEGDGPVLADEDLIALPDVAIGPVKPPPAPVARSTARSDKPRPDPSPPPSTLEEPVALVDPDALLRAANQARRERAFAEADRLYTDLQARFPGSRAARTSRVPHARLLLDTLDRPADALNSFSAYLDADPRGTLSEEALVGQAQALRRLGRDANARDAWRSLLARFPESVHAPTARDQIAEVRP